MNRKLHIVGELMNNSYARARKAFNTRDVEGYRHWRNASRILAQII